MLREKECNLKPRIYKVGYLIVYVDGTVKEKEECYKADSQGDATHKWMQQFSFNPYVKFVRCTEVPIQWN